MEIQAKSKFDKGDYVRYGNIISQIESVHYESDVGFTYALRNTSYSSSPTYVKEKELRKVEVTG